MTFHIITLFPRAFDSYLGESILKRAIEDGKIQVKFYNPRDFTKDKHKRIDRAPYGGGPGMVIQAEPVIRAVEKAYSNVLPPPHRATGGQSKNNRMGGAKKLKAKSDKLKAPIIWLSPSGTQFTNETGIKLAKYSDLIIICGRYEGIDARVKRAVRAMGAKIAEVSAGPYVLTGGELPAMLLLDVTARQVPDVLGDPASREETRHASPEAYTRPEVFEYMGRRYRVPRVLLSGHHTKIDEWRFKQRR